MPPIHPVLTITLNPAIDMNLDVPDWPRGDFTRATAVCRAAGGKGINAGRVLAEMGIASTAMCVIGGPDAHVFMDLMRAAPFEAAKVQIAGATRTNVTIHCMRSGERIKINHPGPAVSSREWKFIEQAFKNLVQGRVWVLLAGALPQGTAVEAYARLVWIARRAGVRVALDCAGESLLAALSHKPDFVKPNRGELALSLNTRIKTRAEALAGGRELVARGARLAVISNGPGECLAVTRDEVWLARPPRVHAGSIMGGGDSIVAGMVCGMLKGLPLGESLRLAIACGAASAAASETHYANREQIENFLEQTVIKKLSS